MGKYDYIPELTDADSYRAWRRAVMLALASKGLWNHCTNGTDPNDVADYASTMPTAATPGTITSTECAAMKEWIKDDAQAKYIIECRLSPVIQNMLGEKITARQQWDILHQRFARLDITSRFELRNQLFSEKLKDAADALRYLSVFENGRRRFVEMGVSLSDEEAIWMLLHGLPDTLQWVVYRSLTMGLYLTTNNSSIPTTPSTFPKVTFEDVAVTFLAEANYPSSQLKLAKSGSEYASAASYSPPYSSKVKYVQLGGGMKGKTPWRRNKSCPKSKKKVTASITESNPSLSASTHIPLCQPSLPLKEPHAVQHALTEVVSTTSSAGMDAAAGDYPQ